MAENWGGQVRNWRGGVNAWIINEYDTYVVIRVEARWQSLDWGFNVPNGNQAYINCDGQNTGWVGVGGVNSGSGQTVTRTMLSRDFTVQKPQGGGRNVWVAAGVRLTGYQPGMSDAGVNIWINSRTYYKPRPPKAFTARRASDGEMALGWQGDYTGMNDYYPWANVYVDRRTDDGDWQTIATLGWDAVNYTDRTTTAGHKYEYGVRSTGPGGTSDRVTAAAIFTTPTAVGSVDLAKLANTSVRVGIDGAPRYVDYYNLQQSVNGGDWGGSQRVESFPTTLDVSGSLKVRVQAVKGTLEGPWRESGTVTTIVAPNAPTISTKPANVVAVGTTLRYGWTRNHPDGSAQTSAQLGYTVGSGSEKVVDIQGAESTYTLPAEASAKAQTVKVRVRTKGVHASWGAWSDYVTVTVAVPPSAHFAVPAVDGAKVGGLPLVVAWDATDSTGIALQRLELLDEGGRVLHSATPGNDTRRYTLGDQTYRLANATAYRLRLTVRGGSSLTVTTERAFATSFAEPARPTATVATDSAKLSQTITVSAGASSSEEAGTVAVDATPGTLVPGLTVFGETRQNMWRDISDSHDGIRASVAADGALKLAGTATQASYFVNAWTTVKPSTAYYFAVDNLNDGLEFYVENAPEGGPVYLTGTKKSSVFRTSAAIPKNPKMAFYIKQGTTLDGTYRVMLREATPEEVAEAASTPATMQEGGTADLPTYPVMALPLYADRTAGTARAFDWVRPGINGAQPKEIVTRGRNLLSYANSSSANGVTWTRNSDGSYTFNGTARALTEVVLLGRYSLSLDNLRGTFTLSGGTPSVRFAAFSYRQDGSYAGAIDDGTGAVLTSPEGHQGIGAFLSIKKGTELANVVVRPMLSIGAEPAAYEPPAESITPFDLKGNQLHGLPNGTRDELRIDGTGAMTIVQRTRVLGISDAEDWTYDSANKRFAYVGSYVQSDTTSGTASFCDQLPLLPEDGTEKDMTGYIVSRGGALTIKIIGVESTAALGRWFAEHPAKFVLGRKSEAEVRIEGITMPEFPAERSHLWASSAIPCTVRVDYPEVDGLSVTRVLADGSRWLVARGLLSGQQAIDPLPPLNTDYDYEIVASTEAGSESETVVSQRIDTRGRMALNFDRAASTAFVFGQNASVGESVERRGELYHFADDGERGGLPMWYPSGDVDVSGDVGFELRDRVERDRFAAIARKFSIGWFRDAMGGRKVARMRFGERIDAGGAATWEETVKMDETVFEEAW